MPAQVHDGNTWTPVGLLLGYLLSLDDAGQL